MKNIRYIHCPQLKIYDTIGFQWIQGLMFMCNPNYRSETCNTDIYGLRFNSQLSEESNLSIFNKVNSNKKLSVMVGNSSTFGVGSSKDEKTIPAILSEISDYNFLNLGARAYNGLQEILLFQLFSNKIKNPEKIILFSGMNDIYLSLNNNFDQIFPGPLFFNNLFLKNMNFANLNYKKKLLKFFLPNLDIDFENIDIKDLFQIIFRKKIRKKTKKFPIMNIEEIVSRNIFNWSLISKSLNSEVIFFFPPFLDWCKSSNDYTLEEKEISDYINKHEVKNNFNLFKVFANKYDEMKLIFRNSCEKNNIRFYDCNEIFKKNTNNWLFVDKVHLTDKGNEIISKFILTKLNN